MDTAKKSCRTCLEQNSSVARVTASLRLMDRCRLIAVQGQRKLQAFRLLAKQRENGGVAPFGKDYVRVFPFDQPRKSESGGLACLVEFPARPIHFNFER